MNGTGESAGAKGDTGFTTTHWSVVLAAGELESPRAKAALEMLCRGYWYPLYAYVRRRGYGPEDAQDLTQEFFVQLLRKNYPGRADRAKGRFRSFLLHTLNQFLLDQRERAGALKRGGGQTPLSLDAESPEERYRLEIPDELTPERLFERRWARTVLDRAQARLRDEFEAADLGDTFAVLEAFAPGEQSQISYSEAGDRLGVSQSAVKSMIHRLRRRHRQLVRDEIAQTVPTMADIDEELRHLVTVLHG